jgi:hypothetical protein
LQQQALLQHNNVEGGKPINIDFKSSQGNSLENLQATSKSFMAIGYSNQLFTKPESVMGS